MEAALSARKRKGRSAPGRSDALEIPLDRLALDVEALVVRIDTDDPGRIHRLASLGILPGISIRLIQNRGAFLAVIDRFQVGFDRQVARAVKVRRS